MKNNKMLIDFKDKGLKTEMTVDLILTREKDLIVKVGGNEIGRVVDEKLEPKAADAIFDTLDEASEKMKNIKDKK